MALTSSPPTTAARATSRACASTQPPRPPISASTFKDATNLASPAASHLTRRRIQIIDANHYDKTETYTENGKDDTTVYHFVRLPAKPI